MAVLPSVERATEQPCRLLMPPAPLPTSLFPCCVQTPPLLVNTQAAPPGLLPSNCPPTRAVFPSADRETDPPCCALPIAPKPASLLPCCVQTVPLLVHTQAA